MKEPAKKKSRWRWLRRAVAVAAGLLVLIAFIPFVSTTACVRFALAHSVYAGFSPTISSASLSPAGSLDIKNLVLHTPAGAAPLLSVADLHATFSWSGALRETLNDIRAQNVTLYARPDNRGGLSLLQLAAAPPSPAAPGSPPDSPLAPAAAPAPAPAPGTAPAPAPGTPGTAPAGHPFWFNSLQCSGQIIVEPFPDFDLPAGTHPFTLTMTMLGDHMNPTRTLALVVGHDPANPDLLARLQFQPLGRGQKITLQTLSTRDLAGGVTAAFARRQFPHLPKMLQQSFTGSLASLTISGSWDDLPDAPAFQAHLQLAGLDIASKPDARTPASLQSFNLSGDLAGPASPDFLRTGTATAATLSLASLTFGKNSLNKVQTDISLKNGTLEATHLTADFAGGAFAGLLDYSPVQNRLTRADLTVAHLDQKKVLANIAPDKIDGDGNLSGVIRLRAGEKTLLKGKIDLTSDGPGHLEIKDRQTAQMLAQSLKTPASTSILPDNFSEIVVGQLRNYPYQTAHIKIADHEGGPLLSLDYSRAAVTKGQPGFAVKTTIGGQHVLANYSIQLPGVTVVLRGKTIEELLKLASGLGTEIAQDTAAGRRDH